MKHYLDISKRYIKQFIREKSGEAIMEFLILLAIFGVSAALITPIVRNQLAETYDAQSKDITFGGKRGDDVITATPQANALPVVDGTATTSTKTTNLFKFDGSTYLQLPTRLNNFGSSDFTLEGWFNINSAPGSDAIFGLNGTDPADNNLTIGVWGGKYHLNPGPGADSGLYSSVSVKKDVKVHLAWSVTNNNLSFYENGILVWSESNLPRNYYTHEEGPKLGMEYDNWKPTDYYDGYMYEVRLYTKGLSKTEVNDNMTGKTLRSSLVGEYLFNEGYGKTIFDHSGNGNNATVVGNIDWETQ